MNLSVSVVEEISAFAGPGDVFNTPPSLPAKSVQICNPSNTGKFGSTSSVFIDVPATVADAGFPQTRMVLDSSSNVTNADPLAALYLKPSSSGAASGSALTGLNGMIAYGDVLGTGTVDFWGYKGGVWETLTNTGGGATAAGATTQVQFNSAGAFGASSDLTFDTATDKLTVGGANAIIDAPGANASITASAANATLAIGGVTINQTSVTGVGNLFLSALFTAGTGDIVVGSGAVPTTLVPGDTTSTIGKTGVGFSWSNVYLNNLDSENADITCSKNLVPLGAGSTLGSGANEWSQVWTNTILTDPGPNITIGGATANSLVPATSNSSDLGSLTSQWRKLYAADVYFNTNAPPGSNTLATVEANGPNGMKLVTTGGGGVNYGDIEIQPQGLVSLDSAMTNAGIATISVEAKLAGNTMFTVEKANAGYNNTTGYFSAGRPLRLWNTTSATLVDIPPTTPIASALGLSQQGQMAYDTDSRTVRVSDGDGVRKLVSNAPYNAKFTTTKSAPILSTNGPYIITVGSTPLQFSTTAPTGTSPITRDAAYPGSFFIPPGEAGIYSIYWYGVWGSLGCGNDSPWASAGAWDQPLQILYEYTSQFNVQSVHHMCSHGRLYNGTTCANFVFFNFVGYLSDANTGGAWTGGRHELGILNHNSSLNNTIDFQGECTIRRLIPAP